MAEANPNNEAEEDLLIDTSKMNAEQRAAMEIAEAARDLDTSRQSFVQELFMGQVDFNHLEPFPIQSEKDKKIGDDFIERFSAYLRKNLDPDEVERSRTIPEQVIDDFFEMGVFAMKIPEIYGGLGFSQVNYNRIMMMLASWCGSTAVLVSAHQSIGVPQPLKMFGTEEQKKKYMPRFRKDSISAFALTEPNVGSDPAQMETEAILSKDGKFYTINGIKLWCTNGPIADILVVMARTKPKIVNGKERKQITAFIVEMKTPGIEVLHRCEFMGLDAIQNGLIQFTNVTIPAENMILGEGRGLKLALATLNTGRLTLPAACTGMAKQCLSIARRFGKKRVQWGSPIGLHEVGREKIAYIACTTFAMEAMTFLTSHFADQVNRDIRIEAAMAKLFCSETAWRIVDWTMQLNGGRGYEKASSLKARGEDPFPIERMMRDCRINTIIEGTSEIMRLFLAREAMDPHLQMAKDLLRKKTPLGKKIIAGIKLMGFYSLWYPRRWINKNSFNFYGEKGELSHHYRFIDRMAQKLSRDLFHSMAKYQDGLEKKQILLGRLIDIGTELFAMACALSYSRHLTSQNSKNHSPIELADLFCQQSRFRILEHFRQANNPAIRSGNETAKKVLDNQYKWLEEGILEVHSKE